METDPTEQDAQIEDPNEEGEEADEEVEAELDEEESAGLDEGPTGP